MRIGVLSNKRAGKRHSKLDRVSSFLSGHPEIFHIETADGEAVEPALLEMERRDIEILVINGGDGTLQHALTYMRRRSGHPWQPWLAPTCGGRTNTSALDIGSDPDPVQGLATLVESVAAGRVSELVTERPVVRVEIEGEYYGMFLGFGMLHRAVRLVHQGFPDGKARGTWGAGFLTAMLVARGALQRENAGIMSPDIIDLTVDGVPYGPLPMRLAMVSTLQRLFFGLTPFWGTEQGPLQMTFIDTSARQAPRVVAKILRRRHGPLTSPENGCHSHNVHRLDLELDGGLILDGELFDAVPGRRVKITADEDVRWLRT